jgi:hypothetical protein
MSRRRIRIDHLINSRTAATVLCKNSRIFVGRSFSYDIDTAESARLWPLKYRFCSSHTGHTVVQQKFIS